MFKKFLIILLLSLFCLAFFNCNAYEYIDPENELRVEDKIAQIYDSKEQYESLAGGYDVIEIIDVSSAQNAFWWPIGSEETTKGDNGKVYASGDPVSIQITSKFKSKENFRNSAHGGIDIGPNGHGVGVVNVIAAKSGTVVYPTKKSQTSYNDNGYYGNQDGYTYGNFVKIQHSDGTYTLYAHLAKDSITVFAGDVVDQGEVIGKLGHSGSSTGPHLHFEMRKGVDSVSNRVDPLDYVDPQNPRPVSSGSGNSFSLIETTLTKEEFVTKMEDYCSRSKKKGFCNNFASRAASIYDVAVSSGVNPELAVVTAGAEQGWQLSSTCQYTNNYWGIGIPNGKGCNAGAKFSSIEEGIAGYAKVLANYGPSGSSAVLITNRYNERSKAGCDPAGHGMPGTLEGMQSVYSWLGNYRFNPGSWGLGGCTYLNIIYGKDYCSTVPTCPGSSNCPKESATTTCEQNDYTAWQLKNKAQIRYDIFGL